MDKIKETLCELAVVFSAVLFLGLLLVMSADLVYAKGPGDGDSGAASSGMETLRPVQVP